MIDRITEAQITTESPAFAKPLLYAGAVDKAQISIYNEDCLQALKAMADKQFDLAIVDPPYGIGMDSTHFKTKSSKAKPNDYGKKDWDNAIPNKEYFNELLRVSRHQIVWGGNYFVENLTNSSCWVVWDKDNGDSIHADCELAWTSFKTGVKKVKWLWHGMRQQNMKNKEKRIHPTQKPVALYRWLLYEFAKEGDKILDTHLGSGSIAIACWDMGYDLTAYEVDKEYYDNACKRLETHKAQLTLW
ncbi:MAG: Modification methylase DpnIIB [Bacteroidetes bacterium ADurb.Bin028]|nr:MAG: Modification methylase DpnIIB [Bacteroidetes bacterium ADurb.Bin028]